MSKFIFSLFISALFPSYGVAAQFQGLGFGSQFNFSSSATAISGDGSTVVGVINNNQAFYWRKNSGLTPLGFLQPANQLWPYSSAFGATYDGSTLVGSGNSKFDGQRIFLWSQQNGMVALNKFDNTYSSNRDGAFAISNNGSAIAGFTQDPFGNAKAITWSNGSYSLLGQLPGTYQSYARDISGDGTTIVGYAYAQYQSGNHQAFIWNNANGMQGLGSLLGGTGFSQANAISSDGQFVFGYASTSDGMEAFRWSAKDGMVGLGDLGLGGSKYSLANASSGDGSRVVGMSRSNGDKAIIWDRNSGPKSLADLLTTAYGLDLTGWQLTSATDISNDGLTIVGNGINPNGQYEAWLANISPVPVPTSAWLFGSGLLGLIGAARRKAI